MPEARARPNLTEMTSAAVPADVVLRDGSTMRFRPPSRHDVPRLVAFFRGLSDQSLYLRFHGRPDVNERLVEPMLEPDWQERGALIGTQCAPLGAAAPYVRL